MNLPMDDTPENTTRLAELKDQRLGGGLGDANGLSWTVNYGAVAGSQIPEISAEDGGILRALAYEVARIAARPEQDEKRKLWTDHNGLRETRPLIFCDPENAWYELIPSTELKCAGNLARIWEFRLRKEIYWAEIIKDDRVTLPVFTVQYVYAFTGRGLEPKLGGGSRGGAFNWDPPLKDYDELNLLKPRRVIVDHEKTGKLLAAAKELFDSILEVKLEGSWWWSFGMTSDLIYLRGFEQSFLDMYDYPEELHGLMAFLRDENLTMLDYLEANNLLSLNNGGDFIGTGGYGWTSELPSASFCENVTTMDMWGYSESQETVNVSPELFEEFVFRYQLPILERFGLNNYGCCEPLDKRFPIMQRIPRLRRVTVSPWSDPDRMGEELGKDYVYVRKVNSAHMAVRHIEEDGARREIRQTLEAAKRNACPAEVLLRDVVTVSWNPMNIVRWVEIVKEESTRVYG